MSSDIKPISFTKFLLYLFIALIIFSTFFYVNSGTKVVSLNKFLLGTIMSIILIGGIAYAFFYASRKNFIFFFEGFKSKKKMILVIFGFFINWMFLFNYTQSNEKITIYYVLGFVLGLVGLLIFFILYDMKPVRKNKKFDKKTRWIVGARTISSIFIVYSLYYLFIYDLKALLLALVYVFGFLFSIIV